MKTIKGYLINVKTQKIEDVEIEVTDIGSSYSSVCRLLRANDVELISQELKDNEVSNVYIDVNHFDKVYKYVKPVEEEKVEVEGEEGNEEEEEKPKFGFQKDEETFPGFTWMGTKPTGMIFSNAIVHGENYIEEAEESNLTKDDVAKLVHFKSFSKSEILFRHDKNFNFTL